MTDKMKHFTSVKGHRIKSLMMAETPMKLDVKLRQFRDSSELLSHRRINHDKITSEFKPKFKADL